MNGSQIGSTTSRGRGLVLVVVAAVTLAGAGAFVVGGSSTTTAGGAADWSPHPGKEVSCPPANETTPDNGTDNDTTDDNATDNDSDDSGYQLVINYTGAWQGTIVTNDTNIPIEGTGDERIDIEADEDERVAATVSKANVTDETMGVTLLLNGIVIDEQQPVEPTVDNFDDQDDGGAMADEDTEDFDSTSSDSAFAGTSDTDTRNETGTGEGWTTFGEENEASAFEDDTVVAADDDDPFGDNETATTSEDSLDSNDSDTTNDATTNATAANETENASDAAEECAPAANTSEPTNDTTNSSGLAVETDEEAQVVFADQDVTGPSLVVESATVPDSGFVVIHDMSLMQEGDVESSVVGVSEKLDAQRSDDIEVTLADEVTESQTLIAVVYRDTDDDGEFEFDADGEMIDEPYRDDEGAAVGDDAYVTVPGDESTDASAFDENDSTASTQDASVFNDTETATATQTATDTDTATATTTPQAAVSGNAEQTTETDAPGFGIGVAIVAMLAGALVAARRS